VAGSAKRVVWLSGHCCLPIGLRFCGLSGKGMPTSDPDNPVTTPCCIVTIAANRHRTPDLDPLDVPVRDPASPSNDRTIISAPPPVGMNFSRKIVKPLKSMGREKIFR